MRFVLGVICRETLYREGLFVIKTLHLGYIRKNRCEKTISSFCTPVYTHVNFSSSKR